MSLHCYDMQSMFIDHSVYPDLDSPPVSLNTPEDQADYVHRICCAWDFGIHPDPETFALFATWKEIFDRFPIPTSLAYLAMRIWFCWEPMEYPEGIAAPTLRWEHRDRIEGRGPDPCERMI